MKFSLSSVLRKLLFLGFLFMNMVFFSNISQELKADTAKKIKIKPDILFQKVGINKTGISTSKAYKLKIKVSVRSYSPVRTCTGPFKIRVEWRANAKRPFIFLGEAGVAKLCYDPLSKKIALATRFFDHVVQPGKTNYYKIVIDPLFQVDESKENNNVMFREYRAVKTINLPENMTATASIQDRLPDCEGIDLIVKNVEVIRNDSGNIWFKATIKNLCTGICSGPIIIEVDESEAMGYASGVEQQIGSGIGSKAEYTMGSAIGVANRSDRVCFYNVSVRTEGGWAEPEAKKRNNTFRVRVDPR